MSKSESQSRYEEPRETPEIHEEAFAARFIQHREFVSYQAGIISGQLLALGASIALVVIFPALPLWETVVAVCVLSWIALGIASYYRTNDFFATDARYRAAVNQHEND